MPRLIRWFVALGGGERLPRTSFMRGSWGYDVTCACGWDSRTGGATRRYILGEILVHKIICPLHQKAKGETP